MILALRAVASAPARPAGKNASRGAVDALTEGPWAETAKKNKLSKQTICERLHMAGLMRCHLQEGQPSLAMAAYQRCRRTLWNRLGVDPSEATRRLQMAARDPRANGRSAAGDLGVQP